ncbi:MAG: nucleotidyltransferase domain-containing protein [Bacteroidetes bacterium]|nr:nucleotidyltransferase domain-containing protein [Bacteroidota bacterium]
MNTKLSYTANNIVTDLQNELSNLIGTRLIKIILYGSYARSSESDDSDIDLIVLTDFPDSEIRLLSEKINSITVDLSLKYDIVVSLIIKNISTFNKYSNVIPFYNNISTDGIVLYG